MINYIDQTDLLRLKCDQDFRALLSGSGCGVADESLTKQICPVTPNTSYETTAFIFVNINLCS